MDINIGDQIKMYRLQTGLTQSELGTALGVQKSAIQKYESGTIDIKLSTLTKLCEIFKITVAELLGEVIPTSHLTNIIYQEYGASGVELFDLFRELDRSGKLKVLTYLVDIKASHDSRIKKG